MSDKKKQKIVDESLDILKAIDKTSAIIEENKDLRNTIKKKDNIINKIEKDNLKLSEENTNVAQFKLKTTALSRSLNSTNRELKKIRVSYKNLTAEKQSLIKDLKKHELDFKNYKTEINEHYKGIRIKSRLINYSFIIAIISIISVAGYLDSQDSKNAEILALTNRLKPTIGNTTATVIGLYHEGGLRNLEYKNDQGEVWTVKNYTTITQDLINIEDRIMVNYSRNEDRVTFNSIELMNQ
tara:strand:- start:17717 stop:18436 length:720 start_codon:yes stop_codon:yes gene_type:complete